MQALLVFVTGLSAVLVALSLSRFVTLLDVRAAARIAQAEQAAGRGSVLERWLAGPLERWLPGVLARLRSDLYWAAFLESGQSPGAVLDVLARQTLQALAVGLAAWLALDTPLALVGGSILGWTLAGSGLRSRAERARLRIAQELPELVQLMAAEAASGVALDSVLRRVAEGPGLSAAWLRQVLEASAGRALLSEEGSGGLLRTAAEASGHPGLVSLAIQLGFAGRGVQVQSLLKSLAQTFADEFIARAEARAERLGSSLGVMSAIFYFMPFVITVLVVVGLPLVETLQAP